jgi:hypothetical protein
VEVGRLLEEVLGWSIIGSLSGGVGTIEAIDFGNSHWKGNTGLGTDER